MEKNLILASASPRRSELLSIAGYEFEIKPSNAEEIEKGIPAKELAMKNALAKARDIYKTTNENSVVIGADTVVCLGDMVLGKPKNEENAKEMLKSLSGSEHSVVTGFAVVAQGKEEVGFCETVVKFRNLSEKEIDCYVATKECNDKAGAYGIQERASLFVEGIKGDYFNVMGLPVASLYPILERCGVLPRWQNILG